MMAAALLTPSRRMVPQPPFGRGEGAVVSRACRRTFERPTDAGDRRADRAKGQGVTREKHLKERVRDRMLATGETYTQAREELRAAEAADSRAEQLPGAGDSDTSADPSREADVWVTELAHAYAKAIANFGEALTRCPADRWRKSVWIVKQSDPFAWPIHRGVGADMSDAKRLQLQSAFWNVAYHAIFHLDFGLEGNWKGTAYGPPAPFRGDDHFGNCLPWRGVHMRRVGRVSRLLRREGQAGVRPHHVGCRGCT